MPIFLLCCSGASQSSQFNVGDQREQVIPKFHKPWLPRQTALHPPAPSRCHQTSFGEILCIMTQVTLELLRKLLQDDFPDVTIQHFEGAPGSKRGDNYTSMVYRISLKGIRKLKASESRSTEASTSKEGQTSKLVSIDEGSEVPEESEEQWEGSVIYKCLPQSIIRREAFKSDELFRNEVAFYTKIWPALSSFQSKWDVKHPFKSVPKCYLAKDDCVILQDLKQYGFVMPDRRQGLTIEQCYTVMTQLSRFHALSLAMKGYDPDGFFELLNEEDGISEMFFVEDNVDYYRSYYKEAIQNAIAMVEEELKDSPVKDLYLDKFKSFCSEDSFFKTMVDVVKPREPLALICHGDCWTNNFLFRYKDGDIAELCIVDYQIVRYASPALDLVYVLYLCLDRAQRTEHQDSLLDLYVEELHSSLLGMSEGDSVFCGSLAKEDLKQIVLEEFKCCSLFGLGVALDMYPIMACDSDEAPNLYQSREQETVVVHESVQPVWTSNAACRRKMTDLVQELVDEGLL